MESNNQQPITTNISNISSNKNIYKYITFFLLIGIIITILFTLFSIYKFNSTTNSKLNISDQVTPTIITDSTNQNVFINHDGAIEISNDIYHQLFSLKKNKFSKILTQENCSGFTGKAAAIDDNGNAYIISTYPVLADDRIESTITKLRSSEKITKISLKDDSQPVSCGSPSFYFLTESGRSINEKGETQE